MSSIPNECDRYARGGHVVVVDCLCYGFCVVVCGDGGSALVGHALGSAVLMCEAGLACVGLAALPGEVLTEG